MHNDTCRRIDCQCGCILDTVVGLDKFDPEFAKIDRLTMAHNFTLGRTEKIML